MLRTLVRLIDREAVRPRVSSSLLIRRRMIRSLDSRHSAVRGVALAMYGMIALRRLLRGRDQTIDTRNLRPGESLLITTRRGGRAR